MKKRIAFVVMLTVLLCALSAFFVGCLPKTDDYDIIKNTKKDNFAYLNQSAENGQIVLIGDSIVEIFPTELLDSVGKKVYNRGISGDFSSKTLERLMDNALNISPSTVFILVGTNDLNLDRSAEEIADYISLSVQKCKESGVGNVIVGSLLPVKKSVNPGMVGLRKNSDITQINSLLKKLCEEHGAIYADIHSAVVDGNGEFDGQFTYDGLHPNAKGYGQISEILLPLLK